MKNHIITDGNVTIVDGIDYNLTLDQAADELLKGNVIICKEFPDYSADDLTDVYPQNYEMHPVQGITKEDAIEMLRCYEAFAKRQS